MNKRNTFFILAPFVFIAFGFYLKSQNTGEDILLRAINGALQSAHYDPVSIDDDFSKKAFELYLDNIDGNKRFLLQSDVDELTNYQLKIDDETKEGTYELFNRSVKIIEKQMVVTEQYYEEILAKPFDFTNNIMLRIIFI